MAEETAVVLKCIAGQPVCNSTIAFDEMPGQNRAIAGKLLDGHE